VASRKRKKVGEPKIVNGEPKGRSVPIRFSKAEIKLITAAARTLDPERSKEQ
jgi:hypothetical protein